MENQNTSNTSSTPKKSFKKIITSIIAGTVFILTPIWITFVSFEPDPISPIAAAKEHVKDHKENTYASGVVFTATLVETIDMLLNKNGGYTSNDLLVKVGIYDNMPNWEKGVIFMIRDAAPARRQVKIGFTKGQPVPVFVNAPG